MPKSHVLLWTNYYNFLKPGAFLLRKFPDPKQTHHLWGDLPFDLVARIGPNVGESTSNLGDFSYKFMATHSPSGPLLFGDFCVGIVASESPGKDEFIPCFQGY